MEGRKKGSNKSCKKLGELAFIHSSDFERSLNHKVHTSSTSTLSNTLGSDISIQLNRMKTLLLSLKHAEK